MLENIIEKLGCNISVLNDATAEVERKANETSVFLENIFWIISIVIWAIVFLFLIIPYKPIREFAKEHMFYLVSGSTGFTLIAVIVEFFHTL